MERRVVEEEKGKKKKNLKRKMFGQWVMFWTYDSGKD